MAKEEQIRTALETYDTETLKDALSLLLAQKQSSVIPDINGTNKIENYDTNFSNFAQAICWLKSKFKFQELDAFSTEADLVYVHTGDRKILLTDTSVRGEKNQTAYSFHSTDEFENAFEPKQKNGRFSNLEL